MKAIIIFICKFLTSFFYSVVSVPVVEKRNERVFKRLLTMSQIDTVEKEIRKIQSYRIEFGTREIENTKKKVQELGKASSSCRYTKTI
jgi:hypothetical protein